jgi:dihydrofolate reductase
MAELTITTFLTLDGVMQAPGGPTEDTSGNFAHGGWVFPYFDTDMGEIMTGIFGKVDAFLLGRGTYDIFAGYWPKVTDEKDVIAHNLNTLPKYVASRSAQTLTWHNSKAVSDVVPEVKALKARYKRKVQVHGSAGLAQTLIENGLIDEFRLLVFPVTVGSGKRLFGSGTGPAAMSLVSTRTSSSGVVLHIYRRAGALKTGSFS